MTARDKLIRALAYDSMDGLATEDDITSAETLIDAYRAEVLREAAEMLEARGYRLLGDMVRRIVTAGPEEKATPTGATATPVQVDVPDGEIKFVGFASITLTGWNVIQLAPDYHGHVFMQIDGWLPKSHPSDRRPVGTAQMTYAHLHGHAIPRDLNVQVEIKGYGGPQKFMKIQWRKDGA